MKNGLATSEMWISGGGALLIYDAPSGLHAMAVGIVIAAYALSRALVKRGE